MKLVVFDLDETLTMVTFMAKHDDSAAEKDYLIQVDFESPWVPGSRRDKLRKLFADLAEGPGGCRRALAVLTKNGNKKGVRGVVELLTEAGLADAIDAMWILPARPGQHSGAYPEAGGWKYFDPPLGSVAPFKADVLRHVAQHPEQWFPQLRHAGGRQEVRDLEFLRQPLRPEAIVLVDDQRTNFQSATARVLRYCKVARYDGYYQQLGRLKDMGGIGAHSDADFESLRRFVEDPWMCKENLQVRCSARRFAGDCDHHPVRLVVFDFDETLTLATFMPQAKACSADIGWTPDGAGDNEWTSSDLVAYNFETPFVEGNRVVKLQKMFRALLDGVSGQRRVLAILTQNPSGAVAVLNILQAAHLDVYFSAIWAMPATPGQADAPTGVHRSSTGWKCFNPPFAAVYDHKADVLRHVTSHLAEWIPQSGSCGFERLTNLRPESVVLVDDERTNFRSDSPQEAKVLRYCKVARYDEPYRDCGLLNQMGGIGAHSDADYGMLTSFVDRPWDFPYEPSPEDDRPIAEPEPSPVSPTRSRSRMVEPEEMDKAPRKRSMVFSR